MKRHIEDNYSFSEHAIISHVSGCDGLFCSSIYNCPLSHVSASSSLLLSDRMSWASDLPWCLTPPPLLYCLRPSLIPPTYYNGSQRGTERTSWRATEDGDRDWRGTEVFHFKKQVKVCCCMIIRSGGGNGSSLHRLRKHVCQRERERRNWEMCLV